MLGLLLRLLFGSDAGRDEEEDEEMEDFMDFMEEYEFFEEEDDS